MTVSPLNRSLWWNSEGRIAFLKENWATQSASAIAKHFGEGTTRSMVIGKAYRLHLPNKQSSARSDGPREYKPRERKVRPPKLPKPHMIPGMERERPYMPAIPAGPLPNVEPVGWEALGSQHCRYIVSADGAETLFCGAPKHPGYPYCAHHTRRCYNFAGTRRH